MSLPADLGHRMRDAAQGLGLADFWRWWTATLAELVPSALRSRLQRWGRAPVVMFEPDGVVVAELASDDPVRYAEVARIPPGEAAGQAGRGMIESLARRHGGHARVMLALGPQQVLRKQLTYPAAVESNLTQVLGYDLDRHTPFRADELYYDAVVTGRDAARGMLRIELIAALRATVDQLRRQLAAWGAEVIAIVPGLPSAQAGPTRVNLLPEDERAERPWRRWQVWVPVGLALALAGAAVALPLVQKRATAIALMHQSEQARVQAEAADALRQQLEQAVENYNFVLGRKYAYPSTVQLLDDVTRILPDDTWLTQLELKTVPGKTKDMRKDILLRGESGNAGRLISLLEDSHLFEQAAPRSPTTKIQPGPGEIFDVGAQVRTLPAPEAVPVELAAAASPAKAGPAGPAAPGTGGPAANPGPGTGASPAGATTPPASTGNAVAPRAPGPDSRPEAPPRPSQPAASSASRPAAGAVPSGPGGPPPAPAGEPIPPAAAPPSAASGPAAPARPGAGAPAPAGPATFGPSAGDGRTPGMQQ